MDHKVIVSFSYICITLIPIFKEVFFFSLFDPYGTNELHE